VEQGISAGNGHPGPVETMTRNLGRVIERESGDLMVQCRRGKSGEGCSTFASLEGGAGVSPSMDACIKEITTARENE
jgi:hypothetical protein